MTDHPTPDLSDVPAEPDGDIVTLQPFVQTPNSYTIDAGELIADAIDQGIETHLPIELNERTLVVYERGANGERKPVLIDRRHGMPTLPDNVAHRATFTVPGSLVAYVNRHKHDDRAVIYVVDVMAEPVKLLTQPTTFGRIVLDDHPVINAGTQAVGRRQHTADLRLQPTEAARRWGAAFAGPTIDQEAFLDLIVDGITQIADPDGATLRDLISDLHAIRTTEARAVIRTGGQATVEVAENVTLHGGTGTKVEVPETLRLYLQPFTASEEHIVVTARIKPLVGANGKVVFALRPVELGAALHPLFDTLAQYLDTNVGLEPLWVPSLGGDS